MRDDIVLNKIAVMERCRRRVEEEFRGDAARLQNFTVQDSIILNVQRACEAAIDLAMHTVAAKRLGLPQDARSAFDLLQQAGILDADLTRRMKAMVGFRNIAIHEYQQLQLAILERILTERLGDFQEFSDKILLA
jgi:uncharacterized protein YutE (UPF0331/DUF86 family)